MGSVQGGRVQVRGGVRRPHALPYFRSGARGTAASGSGFILLLPCGAFRDYTARHPGPSAVSRVRSSSGPRVRQLAPSAASIPSTLPSWTHEDTSVHARGRDRSPEERRTRHITAAVMRLHSLQVCASSHAARPGCYSAPPLSHTHSRREPGEGRQIRDGEMLIIRGEATDSSQYKKKKKHVTTSPGLPCMYLSDASLLLVYLFLIYIYVVLIV